MGPSAESSSDDPCVNAPAAMTTGSLYPGVWQGSQETKESTGDPIWSPRQNATMISGLPQRTT